MKPKLRDTDGQQDGGYQRGGRGGRERVKGPNVW